MRLLLVVCLLIVVIIISLWGAYHWNSSPAFQTSFSYGLPKLAELNNLNEVELEKVISELPGKIQNGFKIEFIRSLYLLLVFFILIVWRFNINSYKSLTHMFKENKYWWIIVGVLMIFSVFIVINYHINSAPIKLKDDSSWTKLQKEKVLWEKCGKEWIKQYDDYHFDSQTISDSFAYNKTDSKEYSLMYRQPYLWYLPYSIINFIFILIPILAIFFYQARNDFEEFVKFKIELNEKIQNSKDIDSLNSAIRFISQAPELIRNNTLSKFCWLLFLFLIAACYEFLIGHKTLANLAIVYTIIGYTSIILGCVVILPKFLAYEDLYGELRLRIKKFYANSNPKDNRNTEKKIKEFLAELSRYSLTKIVFSKTHIPFAFVLIGYLFSLLKFFMKWL